MNLRSIFSKKAIAPLALVAAGTTAVMAMTSFGPDFTPIAKDAQKYSDNVDLYERSYLDGDFISSLLPLPEVSCPDGYVINEESWDSRFHLASWGTAYSQDANKSPLTLRFYSVGRCEKQNGDALHVVGFNMHHTAEYNAYTTDQVLEANFEENSRIGEIIVQKEEGGIRFILPAARSHVLGTDEKTFNGEMIYLTLENFRVKDHLEYETPCTRTPDSPCY